MSTTAVTIRGKKVKVDPGTKADIARQLFALGEYTVTEISKAVPMAYSQAHSIAVKEKRLLPDRGPERTAAILKQVRGQTHHAVKAARAIQDDLETIAKRNIPTARQKAKAEKQIKAAMRGLPSPKSTKVRPGIGKLRTPGHPGDIGAGECANCGYDLVVRKGPQLMLIHVNVTAEEHLAVTQFCTAVPQSLLE